MWTGSGKTSVTAGFLYALKGSTHIKVGPDFIDPIILSSISGERGYNLDRWLGGKNYGNVIAYASRRHKIAVVEGVMGAYDSGVGKGFSTMEYFHGSGIPYVLVVDVHKHAESIFHAAKGFTGKNCIGVVLNRYTTPRHLEIVEKPFTDKNIRILGRIPYDESFHVSERHLGLKIEEGMETIRATGNKISEYLDTSFVEDLPDREFQIPQQEGRKIGRMAIAMDDAFSFYYQSSLDRLSSMFEVEFFSPLKNQVPENPDAIYFGGGYPELHAEKLHDSTKTSSYIRDFAENGGYVYGECGGAMYMMENMNAGGKEYDMAGIFTGRSVMEKRPVLSYTEMFAESANPYYRKGMRIFGHEFHYSRIETREKMCMDMVRGKGINGKDGMVKKNSLGIYTHVDMGRYGNIFSSIKHK